MRNMRLAVRSTLLMALSFALPTAAAASDWQAVERVDNYSVQGASAMEIYQSIGERGPQLGSVRTIAHTDFKLTWNRKYERQGDACVITVNRPNLVITYTLPKLSGRVDPSLRARWDTFIAGVTSHEKVHGDFIRDMVRQIEAASIGLTVENDPQCRKIREELQRRLGEIARAHRERNREFDRVEMGNGGNVHQLILAFVNPA